MRVPLARDASPVLALSSLAPLSARHEHGQASDTWEAVAETVQAVRGVVLTSVEGTHIQGGLNGEQPQGTEVEVDVTLGQVGVPRKIQRGEVRDSRIFFVPLKKIPKKKKQKQRLQLWASGYFTLPCSHQLSRLQLRLE